MASLSARLPTLELNSDYGSISATGIGSCALSQHGAKPMDWLIPQWPARVHALCTTRAGGYSSAAYDSFNLGEHVGDKPADVAANRAILEAQIGAQPIFLTQVHGTHIVSLSGATAQGAQADGCLTAESGLACTIMVADCLPVLLTNQQGSLVAAAHAGWRGLAGQGGHGILEAAVATLGAGPILAWLGPCIGPEVFEVGAEVREAFVSHDQAAHAMFAPLTKGKWLADLQGLARLRLGALGVTQIYGNNGTRPWCTFSNPARYFSHRRDRISGRMAACIWLDKG